MGVALIALKWCSLYFSQEQGKNKGLKNAIFKLMSLHPFNCNDLQDPLLYTADRQANGQAKTTTVSLLLRL